MGMFIGYLNAEQLDDNSCVLILSLMPLADVTRVLCELELTIKKVKVSTTPDGRVVDMFFVTDTRLDILDSSS